VAVACSAQPGLQSWTEEPTPPERREVDPQPTIFEARVCAELLESLPDADCAGRWGARGPGVW